MHELIVQRLAGPRLHRAPHVEGWPALRERALQWPPERAAAVCGIRPTRCAAGARLRHHAPAAIRLNYGMQRVHGGGNAVRLVALLPCLDRRLAPPRRRLLLSARAGSSGAQRAALQRPDLLAGRARAPSTWHHRRRPAARGLAGLRPAIEALVVYNSNPVAVAPESPQGGARFRARGPVHRGAGALPDRHRRPRRLRAAGHHAARALGRAHQPTATPTC
jgi:anaerobic selenocysteine-containing dehydrogenase